MTKKPKGCLFYVIVFLVIWFAGWTVAFRISEIADRSSDKTSKRRGHRPHVLTPFFDARDISNNSEVIVKKGPGDTLLVTQQLEQGGTSDCEVNLADSQFYWREGVLHYFRRRIPQGGILPALGWQTYSGTISRSENGDLHFSTSCREKGLILFVIPFWESFGNENFVLESKNSRELVNDKPERSL